MMYYNHLIFTLPETDMAPENGWLDDEMSFWDGLFSGETCLPTIHFQVLCYFQGKYLFLYSIYIYINHKSILLHVCTFAKSLNRDSRQPLMSSPLRRGDGRIVEALWIRGYLWIMGVSLLNSISHGAIMPDPYGDHGRGKP